MTENLLPASSPSPGATPKSDNPGSPTHPTYLNEWFTIESLDIEAQGIAHRADGKVVFIEGALPFEVVSANVHRKKNSFEQGTVTQIHRESSQRVQPGCPHFGLHAGACGGCKMQHLHVGAQVAVKQRVLEDNLWHLGKVKADNILRPIEGPAWGYRYRARLSVRHVHKKGAVLVGFHERKSRYVADMKECHVLPPHVSALLMPLRALIKSMDAIETLPQIELACGDDVTALVLRHLEPLSDGDKDRLREFATQHPRVQWWLQPKGLDTVHLLDEGGPQLAYALTEFGVTMPFRPTDFTQVNPWINRVLVSRALRLLDVQKHERVIDWFCGLGNFTLPLATQAREVLGVEGAEVLVARARENVLKNMPLASASVTYVATKFISIKFAARNLFEMTLELLVQDGVADKWLIDPPREGAFALVNALAQLHQQARDTGVALAAAPPWTPPKRIVYVSCNPATLARDAGVLVHQAGYRCASAGVVNMFPHTAHVESIAVFDLIDQA
jgi:23S rRNA (uracil1939-C5)-methyltransferase